MSTASAETKPATVARSIKHLKVTCLNVLCSSYTKHNLPTKENETTAQRNKRWSQLASALSGFARSGTHVFALQEATPEFLDFVSGENHEFKSIEGFRCLGGGYYDGIFAPRTFPDGKPKADGVAILWKHNICLGQPIEFDEKEAVTGIVPAKSLHRLGKPIGHFSDSRDYIAAVYAVSNFSDVASPKDPRGALTVCLTLPGGTRQGLMPVRLFITTTHLEGDPTKTELRVLQATAAVRHAKAMEKMLDEGERVSLKDFTDEEKAKHKPRPSSRVFCGDLNESEMKQMDAALAAPEFGFVRSKFEKSYALTCGNKAIDHVYTSTPWPTDVPVALHPDVFDVRDGKLLVPPYEMDSWGSDHKALTFSLPYSG